MALVSISTGDKLGSAITIYVSCTEHTPCTNTAGKPFEVSSVFWIKNPEVG